MKGVKELSEPENEALVAELGRRVAEAAERIAAEAGFDRQAAGVLALRSSMELLLLDASPGTVGAWMQKQGADLERLGGQGGTA